MCIVIIRLAFILILIYNLVIIFKVTKLLGSTLRDDLMASYNRVIMMGNLTRDPDYKQLSSGQAVCRLGLASNRQFKNRQTGDMVQEVCFVDVDVWGNQAESCRQFLQKGRSILVEGRLKLDTWEDNDGLRRNKHTIVADRVTFLSSNSDDKELDSAQAATAQAAIAQAEPVKVSSVKAASTKVASVKTEPVKTEPVKTASMSGEVNLSDDKPFEDDLPF